MIEEISIENFKGFAAEQRIPLRPITLLFGANSSGKTTILQTLLILKQTFEEAENPETVLLPKGKTVDLGSYKELIHAHDISKRLRLGFRLSKTLPIGRFLFGRRTRREETGHDEISSPWLRFTFGAERLKRFKLEQFEIGTGDSDNFLAVFEPTGQAKSKVFMRSHFIFFAKRGAAFSERLFDLKQFDPEHLLIKRQWNRFRDSLPKRISELEGHLSNLNDSLRRLSSRVRVQDPELTKKKSTLVEERLQYMQHDKKEIETWLERLRNYTIETFLEDIRSQNQASSLSFTNFLPSAVMMTEKRPRYRSTTPFFTDMKHVPELVEVAAGFGAGFREVLDRIIYLGPLREYPERHYIFSGNVASDVGKSGKFMPDLLFGNRAVVKRINDWLERFQIGYRLSAKTVIDPDVKDVFTLRLTDMRTGISVSPLDVGFGISQVLPVLVQGVVARERIILVEQPEIHLHPALQAELGSFLADCISTPQRNQFIVETHSEHLILRMQRLIREGKLDHENVSVVFVSRGPSGASARRLRLDRNGEFMDEWPEGFFPERLRELV